MYKTDQLIKSAMDGDNKAVSHLFELWYGKVYTLCYRYFSKKELAEEVCQRTFVSVFKNISKLDDPLKFKHWLFRSAINFCHMEERSRKRRQVREDNWQQINSYEMPTPEDIYRKKEKAEIVSNALQQIPEEQRAVVLLKEYDGLKFREIADLLCISENTAKSRMYSGLKNLRKILINKDIRS